MIAKVVGTAATLLMLAAIAVVVVNNGAPRDEASSAIREEMYETSDHVAHDDFDDEEDEEEVQEDDKKPMHVEDDMEWKALRQTLWEANSPQLLKEDKAMHDALRAELDDPQSVQWGRYYRHLNLVENHAWEAGHAWSAEADGSRRHGHLEETSKKKPAVSAAKSGKSLCDSKVKQHHGYFKIKGGKNKNYFYWLFESRGNPSKDPLVMWLSGGPGCSSELALFSENGPCTVNADGSTTKPNIHSWNKNANIVFVDQPAGTGFSYGSGLGDYDHKESEVAEDLYHFMQELVSQKPQYRSNPFYVFGESYAGHFVPATAHRIYQGNKGKDGEYIALKGFGIGNGLTDPEVQYKYYPKMAFNSGTAPSRVTRQRYNEMKQAVPMCIKAIKNCQKDSSVCGSAMANCNVALITPVQATGMNLYDMRKKCTYPPLCYDFSHVKKYLNSPKVKKILGTRREWKSCSMRVNGKFHKDWMKNYEKMVPSMLENGHTALIYAGDVDFICNWLGNKAWTKKMKWAHQKEYLAAKDINWHAAGKVSGKARHAGGLTFVQIHQAGHMVPMDQPAASLEMLNQYLTHKTLLVDSAAN